MTINQRVRLFSSRFWFYAICSRGILPIWNNVRLCRIEVLPLCSAPDSRMRLVLWERVNVRRSFPGNGKETACQLRRHKRCRFCPWVRQISWRKTCQSTPVFLPGEPCGQRRLVAYSPWGYKE